MDEAEKRRLKKLGRQLVLKRSEELKQRLAQTNSAPFASDEYLANEIAIRATEKALRCNPRVYSAAEIRASFVIHPLDYDPNGIYPFGHNDYWECRQCGDFVPTVLPATHCRCSNVSVQKNGFDLELQVTDVGLVRLVRLLAKARDTLS